MQADARQPPIWLRRETCTSSFVAEPLTSKKKPQAATPSLHSMAIQVAAAPAAGCEFLLPDFTINPASAPAAVIR
jgi:hypothetical protein